MSRTRISITGVPIALQALTVAILVVIVYWAGLGGGFLFDDYPNIVNNTRLHVSGYTWSEWLSAAASSPAADLPRPLAMLSFAMNHYFTGLDPWPMKLVNVLIHSLNGALAVLLCQQVFEHLPANPPAWRTRLAVLVGAAWALHPINLTAVLLVVQRMEVLSHAFVLLGLLLYVAGRRAQVAGGRGWGRILAGLVGCTAVGMASKESAALTPLYALALEWAVFGFQARDRKAGRLLKSLFVFLIVIPGAVGLYWLAPRVLDGAYAGRDFTLGERLLTEARVVCTYMRWILIPDLGQLSLNHDDFEVSRGLFRPVTTTLSLVTLPSLAVLALWLRRRLPIVSLGLLWFLAAHLLTGTVIPLELMFEHRNYFASLGLLLALFGAIAGSAGARHGPLGLMLAALLTTCYGAATLLRAIEWGDPIRLSHTEALKRPLSPRATYDWGRTLVVAGGYDAESAYTREAFKALEQARTVPGSTILPNHALIILANRTGSPVDPAWWKDMMAKLKKHPIGPQEKAALATLTGCANSGACRLPQGAMMEVFQSALSQGEDPEILNIFAAYAWQQWRDGAFSRDLWLRAIELNPAEAQYRINLCNLLIAQGRQQEARQQIQSLRGLGRLGQHDAAAAELERRLASTPVAPAEPRK